MDDLDEQVPDVDLIERLRQGDRGATVELWTRHYPAVLLAARRVTRQPRDAEEIASDAFSGMLSAVASGAGPTTSVRAYLITSVRNLAAGRARRTSSTEVITDDVAVFDRPTRDSTVHRSELELVRVAFAALPRRWQIVLWRTAVDKDTNIDVGRAMDLSPNGVAALAKRARRGFRLAYLRAHLSDRGVAAECEPFVEGLADLAVAESSTPEPVANHVAGCPKCTGRLAELRHVDGNFAGVLVPVIFGLIPAKVLVGAAGASAPVAASAVAAGSGSGLGSGLGWGPWNLVPRTPTQWGLATAGAVGASTVALAMALGTASDATPTSRPGGVVAAPPAASMPSSTAPPVVAPTPAPEPPADVPADVPADDSPEPLSTPAVTLNPSAPVPTSSATPTPTGTSTPTPGPTPTRPPSPSATPTPTPRPTQSPTTTPTPTSPLTVNLEIRGPRPDTAIDVSASAEGLAGPLRLTLSVPDGVIFLVASGDWGSCSQSGNLVTCVADSATLMTRAGSLRTVWAPSVHGGVRATVTGTYADGSPATGSVETSWPA